MNTLEGMRANEMRYPKERKEAVLKKMLSPNNEPIQVLSQEEDICEAIIQLRNQASAEGHLVEPGKVRLRRPGG